MKRVLKFTLIFLVIIVVITIAFMTKGMKDVQVMVISEVVINNLEDGSYIGGFDVGRWSNQIEVNIKEQKITDIKIIKDVKYPNKEISDKLFNQVCKEQTIAVDTISGATVTSKAYLKSIENALSAK